MSLESLVVLILVGLAAGWLAGLVMKGRGLGTVGNIIVGIVGAFLGSWVLGLLGVSIASGIVGSIITAFIGAVILLALLAAFR
ncbi:MAG: GlsB/YeaQ/YmgE family stress response membrane protein [Acidobacteriota bacterium]